MTRPIRVLHLLVTTSPGGGPKHVHDLVRHLPREFEVLVAAHEAGVRVPEPVAYLGEVDGR